MKNLIGLVKSAFENKNLVLDLEARQWCDSVGGVYFGYRMAFTTPDLSTWEVIHASREMQYGYGSHWLHVAAKDFTTLTGISCNGYDIERFFQDSEWPPCHRTQDGAAFQRRRSERQNLIE